METTVPATSPAPETPQIARYDGHLVRGIMWTAVAKWSSQILAWAGTLVVARLLSPSDYGLVGMATVFLGLINIASDLGVGSGIVAVKEVSGRQGSQLNALAVMVGGICFAVSCVAAFPLGQFFHASKLPAVVFVTSFGFLISGFQTVPYSLLQKEMRFKFLAGVDASRALVAALIPVIMAFMGFGYWALVFGGIVGTAAATTMVLAARRPGFARPRAASIGSLMKIGTDILISSIAWYVWSNSDFLVAGRVLGEAPLGAYMLAWTIASVPVEKIVALMSRVMPALYSAIQTEPAALRRYFMMISEAIATIAFPALLGLSVVTDDFVRLAFGEKWLSAATPLQLLALASLARCLTPLVPPVLNVTGDSRFAMWQAIACALTFPAGFYLGTRWGITGVAAMWVMLYPLVSIPLFWRAFWRLQLPVSQYLAALWPAMSGSLLMLGVLLLLRYSLPGQWPVSVRLGIHVTVGSLSYASAFLIFHRGRARSLYQALSVLRGA